MDRRCLVVTSVASATPALKALSAKAVEHGLEFIVVGDAASPPNFALADCEFYDLQRQRDLAFEFAQVCPVGHYARKNVGYLIAMSRDAAIIVETDDDSAAYEAFWQPRTRAQFARTALGGGWVNAYRYFTDGEIWPRGFPLELALAPVRAALPESEIDCPIQQGLIDDDPDVDAVYRMLFQLPFRFERRGPVALGARAWCPFNSQNTTWWRDAFALMYLPGTCSFRLTDIWRSFVAQRIAWANGWSVLFHEATLRQVRNPHDLTKDFADEVAGYLDNRAICETLDELELAAGVEQVASNMHRVYEVLVERGWLDEAELALLAAWLSDVAALLPTGPAEVSV